MERNFSSAVLLLEKNLKKSIIPKEKKEKTRQIDL